MLSSRHPSWALVADDTASPFLLEPVRIICQMAAPSKQCHGTGEKGLVRRQASAAVFFYVNAQKHELELYWGRARPTPSSPPSTQVLCHHAESDTSSSQVWPVLRSPENCRVSSATSVPPATFGPSRTVCAWQPCWALGSHWSW